MASRWRKESGDEINLAPLLDVIFTLLFFFIVATSLRQERQALDVQLPETNQQTESVDQDKTIEIFVARDNTIVYRDEERTAEDLITALKNDKLGRETLVVIRSDGDANLQTNVDVMDACAKAGLTSVLLEAQPRNSD